MIARNCGSRLFYRVHNFHGVGAGLALDREHHGIGVVPPVRDAIILNAVENFADVFQAHRRAVAIRDNQRAIHRGVRQLAVGLQRERAMVAVQSSHRQIHVAVLHRGMNFVNSDLPRGHRLRIELNAHRIFLRAVHLHLRHAFHHRNPLAHQRFRVAIHGVAGQRLRAHRDVQDGLVRRIHFVVRRRRRHVRRQLRRSARDCRLHVLRCAINVAAQVELQGDRGSAERTRGGHRINAGDGGELLFERSGDRRSDGVGTRAGQ